MQFIGSWRSETLRAGLTVLFVPAALLVTLSVLALGGELGGVRSLGQLVVGPALPAAAAAALVPGQPHPSSAVAAAALPRSPGPATRRTTAVRRVQRTPQQTAPVRGRTPASRSPAARQPVHRAPAPRPIGTPTVPAPSPAPKPAPHATPKPGVVHQIGGRLQDIVRPVAPPVGKQTADVIGTVVDLVAPRGG
jgi:hypothetical protein